MSGVVFGGFSTIETLFGERAATSILFLVGLLVVGFGVVSIWNTVDSIEDRLRSIQFDLDSIRNELLGDCSGKLSGRKEMQSYKHSVCGRLQSIEHEIESIKKTIEHH